MKTRRIILDGLKVQASIGMLDRERLRPQPIVIHAAFDTDATHVVDDRDIDTVLDYRKLREALIDEATCSHIDLLETLVDRTLTRVLHDFPGVLHATLRICKPQAFDDCDAVCIEQSRSR
ncbi:MAG: dihydroneopterin aldolase [Castellaniella sp.]|uniref:dihydroneopterin aldolase n=1 Tax=Castellaniella sp. TaxID=1955812 RepID=UPI00120F3528|nr:dihydroneopterin aldolase [Castellaniella sp.]TAN27311.1 MAG: dihydroneopterin aldolase [Castellaniella sp.]